MLFPFAPSAAARRLSSPTKTSMMLLLLTGLAPAQDRPATPGQKPAAALPEVVVHGDRVDGPVIKQSKTGTKTETPLLETPQSISVVGQDEITKRGAQSVTEALNYTPGVLTGAAQGLDSRVDDVVIRGFDVSGFTNNQYLDGLRVAKGGQWTRSQHDVFGLERVEVSKGPSAVLYGQVTPGGLVNQVSKRPTAEAHGLVSARVGTFDLWQAAADSSGPLDPSGTLLYRLVGLYRDGGSQVDHTDLRRFMIAPSLTWNISDDTHLTILMNYQKDDGGATYQFLPVSGTLYPTNQGTIPRDTFIGEPSFNTFEREQYSIGYEFEHRFNKVLTLQQNARYEHLSTYYESVVAGLAPPNAAGVMARRGVRGIGTAFNVVVDTRLRAGFETGAAKHTFLVGLDLYHSEWNHLRERAGAVAPINVYNPVYTGLNTTFIKQIGQDVNERQYGVYLQEQLVWARWHLTLGGRYDDAKNDLRDYLGNTRTISHSSAFTGRAGLLYLFDSGFAPYASYATSFEPVTGTDAGGRPFLPSEGEQFEFGIKYEPMGLSALFTLSAFQLAQENVLTLDPLNPLFQVQTGAVRLRGVEFETKVELTDSLTAWGGITYLESEITRSNDGFTGNDVLNTPDMMASLWLDYTFRSGPLAGLGVGSGIRYVSQRFGDNANAFILPDYLLLDLAVRYDLGRVTDALNGAAVSLRVNNLTNQEYVAKANGALAANYGPQREISLNLTYTW